MQTKHFHDDRPITALDEDYLGFAQPAAHIAESIVSLSSPEGFVLGLEGEWGSGKSSFVNLIIEALKARPETPEIVRFSPWLISTRAALLSELFQTVAIAALKIPLIENSAEAPALSLKDKLLSKTPLKRDANNRKLLKAINSFGGHLSKIGKFANAVEMMGVPYAGAAGKAASASGEALSNVATPTLDKEKESLQSELKKLSRKVVVFIDDLDRLEPKEAVEIVRLVRAVVDFPNIVYVLCYSRKILTQSLSEALSLSDGEKYLDKIVQVTFSVPKPEDFDLRRMFKQKIEELFPEHIRPSRDATPNQMLQRLNEAIDYEGGRTLSTPRDIARALNALQLYTPPIIDKIDLADMTWLQLIRIRNHKLYEWIEEYMNTVSVLINGATLSEHAQQKMKRNLFSILDEEQSDNEAVIRLFSEILPGIRDNYLRDEGEKRWDLFHQLNQNNVSKFVQDRRLGSPQHFRYYFALAKPSMALEDSDFQKFLENAENNVNDAIQYFSSLSRSKRHQGGVWSEAIINRLVNVGIEKVPVQSIPGIVLSLAFAMDKVALNTGEGDWGKYWSWDTAKGIVRTGLKRLSPIERAELVYRAFEEGEALGWLTSLLRDETFSHGLVGDRQKDEENRILTPEEFNTVAVIMRARYKKTPVKDMLKTPQFSNVLFGWLQLGEDGEKEVKSWVQSVLSSDEGLIELMESMRSWSSINDQVVHPLKAENMKHFCEVGEVDNRIRNIAERKNDPLAARAEALLQARELARDLQ